MAGFLDAQLSARTPLFGLKLWVLIGICVGAFIVLILFFLSLWLSSRSKKTISSSKLTSEKTLSSSIPMVSKEINVDHIGEREGPLPTYNGYDDLGSSPRSDTEKGKKTLWKMVEEEDGVKGCDLRVRHLSARPAQDPVDKVVDKLEGRVVPELAPVPVGRLRPEVVGEGHPFAVLEHRVDAFD